MSTEQSEIRSLVRRWRENGGRLILLKYAANELEAAIEEPAAPSLPAAESPTWLPIESAPKDGTPVLLWEPGAPVRHDGIVITGEFVNFEAVGGAPAGYQSGWFDDASGHYEIHPTHWMPLPSGPAAASDRKDP